MTIATTNTVSVSGDTYAHKDEIKKLGGTWDADGKVWLCPSDKAQALVTLGAVACKEGGYRFEKSGKSSGRQSFSKCQVCGVTASRYVKIYRSGECRDCYEERKMGY